MIEHLSITGGAAARKTAKENARRLAAQTGRTFAVRRIGTTFLIEPTDTPPPVDSVEVYRTKEE